MSFFRLKDWWFETKRKWYKRNLLKAYPPWDYVYFYDLMGDWLNKSADSMLKYGLHVNKEKTAKTMKIAGELANRLSDDFIGENVWVDFEFPEPTWKKCEDNPKFVQYESNMNDEQEKQFKILMKRERVQLEFYKEYFFNYMKKHIDKWWD